MATLLTWPSEVLHSVLKWVDPADLNHLSRSCRALHTFIDKNRLLCRDIYLNHFDKPKNSDKAFKFDWENELRDVVKLEHLLACDHIKKKMENLQFVVDTVTKLLKSASPRRGDSLNVELLSKFFKDEANREAFIGHSSTFKKIKSLGDEYIELTPEERQSSAKLHCLYGVPIETFRRARNSRTYPSACSKVYDLSNYTPNTMWGPFMDDGSHTVDWEMVEAVMVVLAYNLRIFSVRTNGTCKAVWSTAWAECVPDSYESLSPGPSHGISPKDLDSLDPYGVSGTWMRVVCFLDYNDLFAYNFTTDFGTDVRPRPPLDITEAIRLIVMELHVTEIEEPGEDDGKDLPVVHFRGSARSMHDNWDPNANSNVKGTVRQTRHGDIRWTSFSIYHGESRWRSEGIQVGGPRSARGVFGNWFDVDYDLHGPAGPSAFWKVSDDIESANSSDGEEDMEDNIEFVLA